MRQLTLFISVIFILLLCSNATDTSNQTNNIEIPQTTNYKLLSLGDSYTIGQSVCETCRFPEQLKDSLINTTEDASFNLNIVATTGWTTTDLLDGISNENLPNNYDLVTLLIGVNNQYQGKDFSIYETEFPELVDIAITKAKGDKNRVIIVSIPDYAYTSFGNGNTTISSKIDIYNAFAKNYCNANNITFVNITDITRNGLEDTDLVASDGLHPSEKAYSLFVERLLPYALEKI